MRGKYERYDEREGRRRIERRIGKVVKGRGRVVKGKRKD